MFLQTLVCDLDPSVFSLTLLLAPCIQVVGAKSGHLWHGDKQRLSAAGSVVSVCTIVVVAWAFISKKITGWRLPQR